MQTKSKRQRVIKDLLKTKVIRNHDELVQLLLAKNISVTQSTLSRDFAELGIVHTKTKDGNRYILNSDEAGKQILKLVSYEIISIEHNENLIVIRTLAGRAQGVARFIDKLNKQNILGTVGGDDTVLIIPDKAKSITTIIKTLENMIVNMQ